MGEERRREASSFSAKVAAGSASTVSPKVQKVKAYNYKFNFLSSGISIVTGSRVSSQHYQVCSYITCSLN